MDIIKSVNEDREIKYFKLENNIKCVLINDIHLDKSYVAININVGSLANKEYSEGLAHLLEHMCFIISKKYQEPNYVQNKVTEFGGWTNAYTDSLNTVYYFNVFSQYLSNMLEIFVDYLTNADLRKENIFNEIKNVDSEHHKNLNNDNFKFFNLLHILSDKKNNYHNFFTGSVETLDNADTYNKIIDFYKKYYVSNNISICIISNHSIKKQLHLVNKIFNSIPSNKSPPIIIDKPLFIKNKNKTFIMQTINQTYEIKYIFEILDTKKYSKTKIFNIFAYLINLNSPDTLKDFLKINNFINNLSSYYDSEDGLFYINIEFTKKGFTNINIVDGYLKYYLDHLLNLNFETIFFQLKKMYEFNFNNSFKTDSLDLVLQISNNIFKYDPKYIITGDSLLLELNLSHFHDLKKYIKLENTLQIILINKIKKYKTNKILIDPNYKTKYFETNRINGTSQSFNININLTNNYLNSKPVYIKNLVNKKPYEIKPNIWFETSSKFNESMYYITFYFNDFKFFNSPKNEILTTISINILDFYIKRNLDKALDINYSYNISIDHGYNQIVLNLSLLNDVNYSQQFINEILKLIFTSIKISKKFIKSKLKNYTDIIKNIKFLNSWNYIEWIFNLSFDNYYHYDILLTNINKIKPTDILVYLNDLFTTSNLKVSIFGNIKEIPKFDLINKYLNNKIILPKQKIKKYINIIHPNSKEKEKCIKIYYYISEFDPKVVLHIFIIQLIFSDLFFNKLRTELQLGYLVLLNYEIINNKYYIFQKVQSNYDTNLLEEQILIFNNTMIDTLKKINLSNWIKILKTHLHTKENNMLELYNKYFAEIKSNNFIFDRNKILLKFINKITINSLIRFINKFILNTKNKFIIKINT